MKFALCVAAGLALIPVAGSLGLVIADAFTCKLHILEMCMGK